MKKSSQSLALRFVPASPNLCFLLLQSFNETFEANSLHSSFVINIWQGLMLMLLIGSSFVIFRRKGSLVMPGVIRLPTNSRF